MTISAKKVLPVLRIYSVPGVFLCLLLFVGFASDVRAEVGLTDSGVGGTIPPGSIGGPCLSDGTCAVGAKCFGLENGNICLQDAAPSGVTACPPQHRFLLCDGAGSTNCRLICVSASGFGCASSPDVPATGLAWWVFGSLLLLFVMWRRVIR